MSSALNSLRNITLLYWILVLTLAAGTSVAFSIVLHRSTRSLLELTRAAEEIGLGELDPWLPPPAPGEVGQLTVAFSQMLDRIRQMMLRVDQSGRLAVVGQMSAYLAHEIRNPLSSIKLNLQRLQRWARKGRIPDFCLEPIEISVREVERLNASVTGVLQLSRVHDAPKSVVYLHLLLRESVDLVASRFQRQGVEVTLILDAGADRVLARPGQLKGAVLNLMINALEAQPNGGHLQIWTALCRLPESGGPGVAIHFLDEGKGVPVEMRNRIWDPFLSTKPGGAGIGLAMAKQGVEENDGALELMPTFSERVGAEFVAAFPLAPSESKVGPVGKIQPEEVVP